MPSKKLSKSSKPKSPAALILIGSVIEILTILIVMPNALTYLSKGAYPNISEAILGLILVLIITIFSIICIISAIKIYSTDKKKIKAWSLISIILGVLIIIISGGGIFLPGSIIIIIGAMLGIYYL
jgi:heme/copper-type cytochrome/quinol oxidase subunit 3